jgi:hypothetical protein
MDIMANIPFIGAWNLIIARAASPRTKADAFFRWRKGALTGRQYLFGNQFIEFGPLDDKYETGELRGLYQFGLTPSSLQNFRLLITGSAPLVRDPWGTGDEYEEANKRFTIQAND